MDFKSVKRSTAVQAGKAAARTAGDIFSINRDTSSKFGKIAETSTNARADKAIAAQQATDDATISAMKNQAGMEKFRTELKSKYDLNKIERKGKRMAGLIGGLGSLASGAIIMSGDKEEKSEAPDYSYMTNAMQDAINNSTKAVQKIQAQIDGLKDPDKVDPESLYTPLEGSGDTDSSPVSSGQAVRRDGDGGKYGTKYSQQELTSFAEQAGFSKEQAKIMGAIGMGESDGYAGIDTSMTIDKTKSKEYSIGLFQINAQAHGDKLTKLGYTEDDLRDPLKNAEVAKLVHDEVGGFTPWSVYTKGIYRNYLN